VRGLFAEQGDRHPVLPRISPRSEMTWAGSSVSASSSRSRPGLTWSSPAKAGGAW
jgi:hypothetical protein